MNYSTQASKIVAMLKESIKEQLENVKDRIDGEVKSKISDLQQTLDSQEDDRVTAASQQLEVFIRSKTRPIRPMMRPHDDGMIE